MAKLADLPKELRAIAGRFRHLADMPAPEAEHRARHIAEIERRMPITGEGQQLALAHIGRLSAALPIGCYLAEIKRLNQLADQAGGNAVDSAAHDFREVVVNLKGSQLFVPGLLAACERYLLGKDPMFDEADIGAVLGATEENA